MRGEPVSFIWVFPKIGVPQNGWFIMEIPIKMDDLGVPLFLETSIYKFFCPVVLSCLFFFVFFCLLLFLIFQISLFFQHLEEPGYQNTSKTLSPSNSNRLYLSYLISSSI